MALFAVLYDNIWATIEIFGKYVEFTAAGCVPNVFASHLINAARQLSISNANLQGLASRSSCDCQEK